MSRECFRSATILREANLLRSSVSRAYYAAYCAAAGEVTKSGGTFQNQRPNPSHEALPNLLYHNLNKRKFSEPARREMKRAIMRLRGIRIVADYCPELTVSRSDVVGCLRDARRVIKGLGVAI
jgi:uncharacterized protein (UPF0332 family)